MTPSTRGKEGKRTSKPTVDGEVAISRSRKFLTFQRRFIEVTYPSRMDIGRDITCKKKRISFLCKIETDILQRSSKIKGMSVKSLDAPCSRFRKKLLETLSVLLEYVQRCIADVEHERKEQQEEILKDRIPNSNGQQQARRRACCYHCEYIPSSSDSE